MGMVVFKEADVDYVVLETGLVEDWMRPTL